MIRAHRGLFAAPLLAALTPAPLPAADIGVAGTRLVVIGRGSDLRKGKVIFEVVGDAGIAKGPAPAGRRGDPGLSGTLHVYYTDSPGHLTGRWVLPAPWKKNRGKVARFTNRGAPNGPTTVERVTVRDGKAISVVAKGLGDEGAVANLGVGAPSARGGVKVVLTIHNANDGSTHRMCTRFATAAGSQVRYTVGPRGRKLVATGGVADDCAADIAGAAAPECEGLNAATCLLPYPSSRFLVPANTPTGFRVRIPQAGIPHVNGEPFSAALLNDLDGFSPGVQILMHFPQGVDPERSNASRLLPAGCCGQPPGPPWTNTRTYTGRSREPDSPTVLLDTDTGERVLHFIEPDARAANNPPRQALFLRPARLLTPGHHYVVAMRNLVSPNGAAVIAEPAFAALRDDVPTDVPAIEARRADMEARVFAPLAAAGVTRHDLVLAFDFVVQSDFGLTFQMLSMRDQAFAWLGAIEADPSELSFTVDEVTENDCAVAGQFVWRDVRGTYASPLFLTGDLRSDTVPVLYVDTDGFPALGGITHPEFSVSIPCSAQNPEIPPPASSSSATASSGPAPA